MLLFALVPGMPFLPFMLRRGWAWHCSLVRRIAVGLPRGNSRPPRRLWPRRKDRLGDVLDFDDIHVEFAPDLVPMVLDPATGLDARIANMRTHVASAFGLCCRKFG